MAGHLPPLRSLRFFEAAARHLSFKRAAEDCFVTPSAVSHAIKALEDDFGRALFRRKPGGLELTPTGEDYLPEVRRALALLTAAADRVAGRDGRQSVSLSAAPTFAARRLVASLAGGPSPARRVALDCLQDVVDLERSGIDMAVRMGRGPWPGLIATLLQQEALIPVAAPAVAEAVREPGDLRRQTLLHVSGVTEDWRAWAESAGVDAALVADGPRFAVIGVALEAAAAGMGVAMGRLPLAATELASGRLRCVLGPPQPAATGYWLLAHAKSLERPEVSALHAWLAAGAAQQPR